MASILADLQATALDLRLRFMRRKNAAVRTPPTQSSTAAGGARSNERRLVCQSITHEGARRPLWYSEMTTSGANYCRGGSTYTLFKHAKRCNGEHVAASFAVRRLHGGSNEDESREHCHNRRSRKEGSVRRFDFTLGAICNVEKSMDEHVQGSLNLTARLTRL